MTDKDFILQGFDRVHSKLDNIEKNVGDLKEIVIDSKNRIDHIEANYSRKIDWKNLTGIIVSFCAILAVMISVAQLYKPSAKAQVRSFHSPKQIAPTK